MPREKAIQPRPTTHRQTRSGSWRPKWQALKANSAAAAWKPVFSKVPCEKSRGYTGRAASLAGQHLRRDLRLGVARPIDDPADVRVGRCEPRELLSGLGAEGAQRRGVGATRCRAANGTGAS